MARREPHSFLFVCLGNICRSPLAQAAFEAVAMRERLDVVTDSAGTGDWHVGRPPDRRAQAVALRRGIDITGYRARQISPDDFFRFTHIFALDHQNLEDILAVVPPDATAAVSLLLDAVGGREGEAVADPYFGDESGFDITWSEVSLAAEALALCLAARRSSGLI